MSYDGQTSRRPRYVSYFTGNATSITMPLGLTTCHLLRRTTSTFSICLLRLQGDAGYATTTLSWHFESTLGSSNHLNNRCMWYTNGSTVLEKWYPPISQGLASSRYFGNDNFTNSTGNGGNMRTDWEI